MSKNFKRRLDLVRFVKKLIYIINSENNCNYSLNIFFIVFKYFLIVIWLFLRDNYYGGWLKLGEIDMMEFKGGFFYYYKLCIKMI